MSAGFGRQKSNEMSTEQNSESCQSDVISRFSELPSRIGLNQLIEFHTYDFHDLIIFDMQLTTKNLQIQL